MINSLPADIQVTVLTPDSRAEKCIPVAAYSVIPFRYAPKSWQQLAHGSGGIMAALARNRLLLLLLPSFLGANLVMSCWCARTADVLHANWSINGVIAGIAGLLCAKPVITTLRGSDVNLMEKSWLMRQLVRICLRRSKYVVTVSPSLKKNIDELFPHFASKVRVIANGIDKAFFLEKKDLSTEQAAPVRLLYVGNLTPGKEVRLILEAAASLPAENWVLDIVGDGPEKNRLEAYCQDDTLTSRVIFHGAVAPEQVPLFMARADVFVFASCAEGRPNVVLEAMAARLPVLAAAIPAVLDLIEDGKQGLLFPVHDAEKLAEQLAHLINHPVERRIMGERARSTIESLGLNWQKSADQYAALYTEALLNGA